MNVILADGRPDHSLVQALAERGCPARQVTGTADEALRICRKERVDAVISSAVFLTGLNCVQLAEELSVLKPPPRLLVISPFPARVLRNIPGFPPPGVPVFANSEVEAIVRAVRATAAPTSRETP